MLVTQSSFAARLAIVAVPSNVDPAPVQQADALASALLRRGHRVIASPDVAARLLAGNDGSGRPWAAELSLEIRQGRDALARLDRHSASVIARRAAAQIIRSGGGSGGAEVLVQWALLERALAQSNSDAKRGRGWLHQAAVLGPTVQLDPLLHPVEERNLFAQQVAASVSAPAATLHVSSVPDHAQLWVDGMLRCTTPCDAVLAAGRHFVRVSSAGHAPATFEAQLSAATKQSRQVGLTAAYSGAPIEAIEAMLANPARTNEARSALVGIAHFLDVDHVVVLQPQPKGTYRLVVAPPGSGGAHKLGISPQRIDSSVSAMLGTATGVDDTNDRSSPWYTSSGFWIGAAAVAAAAIGATVYLSTRSEDAPSSGTLIIGGR